MKIIVNKKPNEIVLNISKTYVHKGKSKIRCLVMYDTKERFLPSSVNLTHIQTRTASTLLARWINANCAEQLLTLVDRAYTVERVKDGVGGKWYFTNKEDALWGLHKTKVKSDGVTYRVVSIDSSIGMQAVEKIINTLGIDIESEYDKVSNKMIKINLKGV